MPTWATVLLSLVAVGFGWCLSEFSSWLRTRPSLTVAIVASRVYWLRPTAPNQRFSATAGVWLAVDPRMIRGEVIVAIRLDVSLVNRSLTPDVLTGVRLSRRVRMSVAGVSAVLSEGAAFNARSIDAVSATVITLWFVADRVNYSEWIDDFSREYQLELTSLRGKKHVHALDLGGSTVALEPDEPVAFDTVLPLR